MSREGEKVRWEGVGWRWRRLCQEQRKKRQETTQLRSLEQLRIASGVLQHQEGMEVSHPHGWTGNKEEQRHQKGLDRKGDTRMAMLTVSMRTTRRVKGQWGNGDCNTQGEDKAQYALIPTVLKWGTF